MKCVVWMDRREARIFFLSTERMERRVIHAHRPDHHTHRVDDQMERESVQLYRDVSDQLVQADGILIIGPGVARKHFETYLAEHAPKISARVVGSETMDHPTDPEIAAYASRYFVNGKKRA